MHNTLSMFYKGHLIRDKAKICENLGDKIYGASHNQETQFSFSLQIQGTEIQSQLQVSIFPTDIILLISILPANYEKKLFSCSVIFCQFDPHWKSLKNHIMWALWDRSPSQHWVLQVSRDTFCLKMGRNLGRNYKQPRQRSVSGWPGMTLRHFCETSADQTVSKTVSLTKEIFLTGDQSALVAIVCT